MAGVYLQHPIREYLTALAQKYWVIAPDLPGYGRSPCSRSLTSYQTYANCILQFIECLNLDGFELVGHSFGGGVALALAAARPHAVNRLIVIGSTGVPLFSFPNLVKRRFIELPQQIAQLGGISLLKIIKALGHNLIFRTRHSIAGAQIVLQEDLRPWLSEIKSPCLVLWGERDNFIPIEIGYSLVETIANSKLQIAPGAYHESCMMQPKIVATITSDFLKLTESIQISKINHESRSQ